MFRSILIANRGEIAVRIIRACRNMGIKSIAVYSKEDKDSLHVQLADRRVCIGEGPAKNSYLNMERIISAAKNTAAGKSSVNLVSIQVMIAIFLSGYLLVLYCSYFFSSTNSLLYFKISSIITSTPYLNVISAVFPLQAFK